LQELFSSLAREVSQIEIIQWAILIFGVSEVLLAKANNIYLYPMGLAATLLSVIVLFKAQLFAESLLNVYYVIMSIYGWWLWKEKSNKPPVKITRAGSFDWIITGIIGLGGWMMLFIILKEFTPSTVPAWDAWVSSTAWSGMWLLARRKVENWILLNLSNAFAIPLLFQKQLPLFALLTLVLFIVACFGYADWVKIVKKEMPISHE
jgi:nicotinamide mononucleotide transporter